MQLSQQVFEHLSTPCKNMHVLENRYDGRIAYLKCVSSYERDKQF